MESEFVAHVLRQLEFLGPVEARAMFGGHGLIHDELLFAVACEDVLYLCVDAVSRLEHVAAGMGPFAPPASKQVLESYYELPLDVLESREELARWTRRALEAARGAGAPKALGSPRAKKAAPAEKLLNLGPVSLRWLADVGIHSRAELERAGSVGAFKKVAEAGHKPSVNLLYALEGALQDLRWDRLSAEVKQNLLERAGLAVPKKTRR